MFELFFLKTAAKRKAIFLSQTATRCGGRFFSNAKENKVKIAENFEPPKLHVLEEIAANLSYKENKLLDMSNTGLIGVQHMLPTTASLFGAIHQYLKIQKENMFFAGNFYSNCPKVEDYIGKSGIQLMLTKRPKKYKLYEEYAEENMEEMWEKFISHLEKNSHIDKILILDESGYCLKMMPKYIPYRYKVAAIKQTRPGLHDANMDLQIFHLIDVEKSVAKRKLEPTLITATIISRIAEIIRNLGINRSAVCGVIGGDAIGSGVARYLLSLGFTVNAYDEYDGAFNNIHNCSFYRLSNIGKVISASDIIFGCTGKDISHENDILSFVNGTITLVSCSSQNIEFLTLLKKATKSGCVIKAIGENISKLQYVEGRSKEINILEEGFPINFDRMPKSDPIEDMELIRCLLYCAVVQASLLAKKPVADGFTINDGHIYMLDPYLQRAVVRKWVTNQPKDRYSKEEIDCFNDVKWIASNSSGEYFENEFMKNAFSSENNSYQISSRNRF